MRESRVATDALISQLMVQFIGILYAQNLAKCWYFERLFGFLSQEKKKKSIEPAFSTQGFNICSAWFKCFDTNSLVYFVNVQDMVQVSNMN